MNKYSKKYTFLSSFAAGYWNHFLMYPQGVKKSWKIEPIEAVPKPNRVLKPP
jgi:hypothetical protein